jgi:hypothetical protein
MNKIEYEIQSTSTADNNLPKGWKLPPQKQISEIDSDITDSVSSKSTEYKNYKKSNTMYIDKIKALAKKKEKKRLK